MLPGWKGAGALAEITMSRNSLVICRQNKIFRFRNYISTENIVKSASVLTIFIFIKSRQLDV